MVILNANFDCKGVFLVYVALCLQPSTKNIGFDFPPETEALLNLQCVCDTSKVVSLVGGCFHEVNNTKCYSPYSISQETAEVNVEKCPLNLITNSHYNVCFF